MSGLLSLVSVGMYAQIEGLTDNTEYKVEMNGSFANGEVAPFWFSSGQYGLSSVKPNSGYLRAGISRAEETDTLLNWRYGYGVDVAVPVNYTSDFVIQQLYAVVQLQNCRMTVGTRELPEEMLNNELSSGGMTLSRNFRPIPQVRIDLPEWWTWHATGDWISVKGHIAYGIYTDSQWQKNFVKDGAIYTRNSLFHSKAGFVHVGNDEKSPVSATVGLEMACQFGGKGYNIRNRDDAGTLLNGVDLGNGLRDYWDAFIPGGNDVNDGDYENVAGNQTGNWYFDLMYKGKGWKVKAYAEHFFEDHSQLFVQYGWKDMLWGIETEFPKNPFVSSFVAEYLYTKDQTGGIYHDSNGTLPVQISGKDNYYNHHVYGAWQHWGQNIGNPLLLSPIYNDGVLSSRFNRVNAIHIGVEGSPMESLHYRLMFSNLRTLGTYDNPTPAPIDQNYFLAELTYRPSWMKGWTGKVAFGMNSGGLVDRSSGFELTITKTGILF